MSERPIKRKRKHHLRVPVFPEEQECIERLAAQSGRSVAAYLREVGQGYQLKSVVDYEKVREMAAMNGDLGRLGGLLKLWLTNDAKTVNFTESTIRALIARVEQTQDQMRDVMRQVIHPRKAKRDVE